MQILKGLSLDIEPGQRVAIVGPSGNGKSTILQLIQQLYSPTSGQVIQNLDCSHSSYQGQCYAQTKSTSIGVCNVLYLLHQITIDGVKIQGLDPAWVHQNVAVVPQEPILFNTTVRDNILLANPQATQDELEAATTSANVHSFITELPDGYDTYVGEGGIQLSGGQKQRVAIARALLRNPKILLLDEATSALDNHSERLVQSALEKASEGRTTIVVTHRLSTVQNADMIVCINSGQVHEAGTHEELLMKKGLYSELVGTQIRAATNGKYCWPASEIYPLRD